MSEDIWTAKEITQLFGITSEGLRKWAIEFSDYLSPRATPGKGQTRRYNDEDMGVLTLIARMKDEGFTYANIHAALKSGQRGETPEKALQERDSEGHQLAHLTRENITLKVQLEERDQRIEQLEEDLDEANERNEGLQRELREEYSRGFLDALRKTGKLDDDPKQ